VVLNNQVLSQALITKRNKKGKIERLGILDFLSMKKFTAARSAPHRRDIGW